MSDDPLTSRLRLFLSVDMVGSTAFKQANQTAFDADGKHEHDAIGAEPWFPPIAQFYREIERLFSKEWDYYCKIVAPRFDWPTGDPPQLWKSAGDELLYTKVLSDHREALACTSCWMKAIREYRSILRSQYGSLDLKTTAWVAGFPITNTEVIFRSNLASITSAQDDDDPIYTNLELLHQYYTDPLNASLKKDFLGPSIDTGFRLCSLASVRRFIVSLDLTLMIVHAIRTSPPSIGFEIIHIHYYGRVPLKGVFGGAEYPVFWIDMASDQELERQEDRLLGASPQNTDDIKAFCESFFAAHSHHVLIPYIVGNPDKYFGNVPEHHARRLEILKQYLQNERDRRKDEANSAALTDKTGEIVDSDTINVRVAKMLGISKE